MYTGCPTVNGTLVAQVAVNRLGIIKIASNRLLGLLESLVEKAIMDNLNDVILVIVE